MKPADDFARSLRSYSNELWLRHRIFGVDRPKGIWFDRLMGNASRPLARDRGFLHRIMRSLDAMGSVHGKLGKHAFHIDSDSRLQVSLDDVLRDLSFDHEPCHSLSINVFGEHRCTLLWVFGDDVLRCLSRCLLKQDTGAESLVLNLSVRHCFQNLAEELAQRVLGHANQDLQVSQATVTRQLTPRMVGELFGASMPERVALRKMRICNKFAMLDAGFLIVSSGRP